MPVGERKVCWTVPVLEVKRGWVCRSKKNGEAFVRIPHADRHKAANEKVLGCSLSADGCTATVQTRRALEYIDIEVLASVLEGATCLEEMVGYPREQEEMSDNDCFQTTTRRKPGETMEDFLQRCRETYGSDFNERALYEVYLLPDVRCEITIQARKYKYRPNVRWGQEE